MPRLRSRRTRITYQLLGDDPAIWLATGRALAKRKRDEEALELFGKAVRFYEDHPDSETLIPMGRKCRCLHFPHAGGGPTELEPDNTQIASYVRHYADGSQEETPVPYGQDLRSWVVKPDPADMDGAKVA